MANFLALAALIEPDDEVLIEQPTYEPLLLAARHLGATVNRFDRLPSGAFEIDAGAVIAAISPRTRVVVLSNLHNPSSQHVENSVLRAIGDAAARVGARVLVDEVYLDAVEDGHATCVQLGPQFLSTSSLTKIYGLAALRCGWVIADDPLARRIRRLNDLYENVRPLAPDWLATVAFDHLSALGSRTRALVHANRSVFVEWAAGRDDLTFVLPRWGTTLCVRPLRIDAGRLCEELRVGYDVSVVPGRFFELPDHFRLALCTDSAVLREGLARLGQCLDTA
jgi:aspartate/methionine/tyrosine aminotransferase